MKKYNSVLTLSFSVDHDELNGSDITPEMLREGLTGVYLEWVIRNYLKPPPAVLKMVVII
tara:strand:+ start:512 stop:691 length:180 start_codon:yes stop_codon:yes gene_type:complete